MIRPIETPQQFAEARHSLGLSVSQCAKFCKVDDRTVRRWELGQGKPGGRDPAPSACRLLELAVDKKISQGAISAVIYPPDAPERSIAYVRKHLEGRKGRGRVILTGPHATVKDKP